MQGFLDDPDGPTRILCYSLGSCVAWYALGLLVAVASVATLARWDWLDRLTSVLIALLLVMIGSGIAWTAPVVYANEPSGALPWAMLSTVALGFAAQAYVLAAGQLGRQASLCCRFAGSMAAAIMFLFGTIFTPASYGMHASLAASVVLLLGTVGQAAAISDRGWCRTGWQLMTCSLRSAA
jgi:hypothetical protein